MMNFTSWGKNDEARITAFENTIGFSLPTDYRLFLTENNGGTINSQAFFVKDLDQDILADVLYGITSPLSRSLTLGHWLKEFGDELPEKTLLFGSDPGGGFLMYVTTGEDKGVYYWDHSHFFSPSSEEEGNSYFLADSFTDFCESLMDYTPA